MEEPMIINGIRGIIATIVFVFGCSVILLGLFKFCFWLYELGQAIIDRRKDATR